MLYETRRARALCSRWSGKPCGNIVLMREMHWGGVLHHGVALGGSMSETEHSLDVQSQYTFNVII